MEPDSPETFLLAGADVYRLSCQACHGPDGVGGPPDIGSLVGPVQGTSLVWLTQRMLERGRPVDEGFLQSVSLDAARDLRDRIREGGEKMPPFGHLQRDEIDVLLNYLERLAQLPDAGPDRLIDVPSVRAGELLVKGTCHICHDATGPGGRTMMMTGAIPSLASFGTPRAFGATVAKVRTGSSGFMMMPMMRPSRMPIFPYLTPEEVAAAIVFLTAYPPQAAR